MSRTRRTLLAGVVGVLAAVYWLAVRPWHLRWGTATSEATGRLPGDDLVPRPVDVATHAVTIDAPAEEIWPWLAQLGQGRGGFYSYDFLENLVGADIHNADRVLPEHQDLDVGDVIRLAPPDAAGQSPLAAPEVAVLDEERALVLASPDDPPTYSWAFVLDPVDETTTRFVVRMRGRAPDSARSWLTSRLLLEPLHFVMERKMLLGVKARAEEIGARRATPIEIESPS